MPNVERVTAADVQRMQGLARRVTATRPDLVNSDATFGELAWNWGKGHAADGVNRPRRLWFSGGDLVAWSWARLPHRVRRSDGSVKDATADEAGPKAATADEASPKAAVQAHLDAWAPSTYTAEGYQGVRQTEAYRGDLHLLVEAPDGTMASSTIMWLDEANKTVEFEPVGTHPEYRRLGLGRAMLLHGCTWARAAGARRVKAACLGAPGHPQARGLYYGVGFREFTRDVPLVKTRTEG
ncbi:GNAT family N-acetyltransferase [Streptomyces sp. NPDC056452]|uniref:GNAT family N-acetyltransferase n=1 Tax=Streptomyces sp. NPDC056452 TaxID=3345821 RepID=UPI0036AD221E